MPPITWTELVLALAVIGLKRAWQTWRRVPTHRSDDEQPPLTWGVTNTDPPTTNRV